MDATTAYTNVDFIPNGADYPAKWQALADAFRAEVPPRTLKYGAGAREALDLFLPEAPKGLVVFVHGGYWRQGDRSLWSHLAAGPIAHGWAVAVLEYDLCPDVLIQDITAEVARAIEVAAAEVDGPVHLTGHSAGGHLVARMGCEDVPLGMRDRIARIVSISPLGDIAPLMQTAMNADLRIDAIQALTESPVRRPAPDCPVTVWVGADERPVFLAQARQLSERWNCGLVVAPERHHFDVVEDLAEPDSALTAAVLGH